MKRGFSFIEFKYPEHAASAVRNLDRSTLKDKSLRVEKSSKFARISYLFKIVPGGGRRRRVTGPQAEDECWGCGKSGHW
jgi:RNA recognition motif-containing protein